MILQTLIVSLIFCFRKSLREYLKGLFENKQLLVYYMVPSFLYCFYNNLSFANLISFDPTSYFMFLQARLLITGVIYQVWKYESFENLLKFAIVISDYQCKRFELEISEIIWFQFVFKKYLSRKQWLSLLILTVGCVIQKMDIPSFRSQSEIANPKARIEDSTKDNTNILPQPKTLDSTYISMSAGLFFIFVQVRFSVYNTPNLIQNYFS